jgi:hypothetical protein
MPVLSGIDLDSAGMAMVNATRQGRHRNSAETEEEAECETPAPRFALAGRQPAGGDAGSRPGNRRQTDEKCCHCGVSPDVFVIVERHRMLMPVPLLRRLRYGLVSQELAATITSLAHAGDPSSNAAEDQHHSLRRYMLACSFPNNVRF